MSVRFKKMKLRQSLAKIKSLPFTSLKDPFEIYKLGSKCERLNKELIGWRVKTRMTENECKSMQSIKDLGPSSKLIHNSDGCRVLPSMAMREWAV